MVRYLVAAAGILAMVSGVAVAEPMDGTKTITVTRTPHGKMITKRYVNHYGKLVTKSKSVHEGFSGSSVTRTRSVTDPTDGTTVTRSHTMVR